MKSLIIVFSFLVVLFFSIEGSHGANAASFYHVTLSYSLVGSGNVQPPAVQFVQGGKVIRTNLTMYPTTYTIDGNSGWNATLFLLGSDSTQRWALSGSGSGTGAAEVRVLTYYKQAFVTFGFHYRGNGKIFPLDHVNYTAFGKTNLIYPTASVWADSNTPYSYVNKSNFLSPVSRWYIVGQSGFVQGPGIVSPEYFEQYKLNFAVSYLGQDPFGSTTLTESYLGASVNHTLTTAGGSFWVDYNSSFAMQPTLHSGTGAYRWFLHFASETIAIAPANVEVQYVEQFPISIYLRVSGGAEPSPLGFTATISRQVTTLQLSSGKSVIWVDSEFGYQISNPLLGSTSDERWSTNTGKDGIASGPVTLNLTYYHQVLVPLSYSVVGGGAIPPFYAGYMSFGTLISVPVGTSPSGQWIDYGSSLGVPWTFAGNTQFERFDLGDPPRDSVTKPGAVSLVYYHQYHIPFVYTVSGQGSPPVPVLNGFEFGVEYGWPLSSGTSTWLDGDSTWSVSNVLSSNIDGERWAGAGSLNGTVSLDTLIAVTYQHEYYVSVTCNPLGGGSLSGGGWTLAGETIAVSTTPIRGYAFVGWQGSGQGSYSGYRENYTALVAAPMQEVAEYYVALVVQTSGRGSVSVSIGSHSYSVGSQSSFYVAPGTRITLVANPGLLQTFSGWVGIPGGSVGAITFTADKPYGVAAAFTLDRVGVLGFVTLYFGMTVFVIFYVVSKRRSTSIFRPVRSYV